MNAKVQGLEMPVASAAAGSGLSGDEPLFRQLRKVRQQLAAERAARADKRRKAWRSVATGVGVVVLLAGWVLAWAWALQDPAPVLDDVPRATASAGVWP